MDYSSFTDTIGIATSIVFLYFYGSKILIPFISIVYPCYFTIKSYVNVHENSEYLIKVVCSYWTVFSFFYFIQMFTDIIFSWLPFYYLTKLIILLYITGGNFVFFTPGCLYIFDEYITPFFQINETRINYNYEYSKEYLSNYTSNMKYIFFNIVIYSGKKLKEIYSKLKEHTDKELLKKEKILL